MRGNRTIGCLADGSLLPGFPFREDSGRIQSLYAPSKNTRVADDDNTVRLPTNLPKGKAVEWAHNKIQDSTDLDLPV